MPISANRTTFFERPLSIAIFLTAITLIAAILRIPTLKMGLWQDELIALYISSQPTMQGVLNILPGMDVNPPFFHLILRAFLHFVPPTEITVRIPSYICGLLLIPSLYWLGAVVHSRSVGLLSALFAALSPLANYFSCQTRCYSMATLLCCWSLIAFCSLFDPKARASAKRRALAAFVLSMIGLCYSTNFGIILLFALTIAAFLLLLRQCLETRSNANLLKTENISILMIYIALFLPALSFLPWLRTLLWQVSIPKWMPSTPLYYWPLVFLYCLTMMLPVAPHIGVCITALVVFAVIVYLLLRLPAFLKSPQIVLTKIRLWWQTAPSQYIILLCAAIITASLVGYAGPFWFGYYRYIYPFSPPGVVLAAIGTYNIFTRYAACPPISLLKTVPGANQIQRYIIPIITLSALFFVDVSYILCFDSKPQSGLKQMAKDIRNGKFDHCAIILAPDGLCPTLHYYLSDQECAAHHILIRGFVRWHAKEPPDVAGLKARWHSPKIVDDALERIEQLHKEGYEYLAFAGDIYNVGTEAVPFGARINELKVRLFQKYKLVHKEQYTGITEAPTVYVLRL